MSWQYNKKVFLCHWLCFKLPMISIHFINRCLYHISTTFWELAWMMIVLVIQDMSWNWDMYVCVYYVQRAHSSHTLRAMPNTSFVCQTKYLIGQNFARQKLQWTKFRQTKYLIGQNFARQNFHWANFFGEQNFRHQLEISVVMSDEIFYFHRFHISPYSR